MACKALQAGRINSNLNGRAKKFGWLQAPQLNFYCAKNFDAARNHPNLIFAIAKSVKCNFQLEDHRIVLNRGMVSQAVAFNMFLSFFAILLAVLGMLRLYLEGKAGQELVPQLQAILPPGSCQLVSNFVFRSDVSAWYSTLLGWIGTLMVGLQTVKLMMEGFHMISGSCSTQSFLGRQLRALLLFAVAACTWLVAVTLSVFGMPLRQLMINKFGDSLLIRASWSGILSLAAMIMVMLVLAFIYRFAEPRVATWISLLPGAAIATGLWWAANELFGIYVRKTQYGPVYGGLAAVIGLLGWMELSVMLVFWGAERRRSSSLPQYHGRIITLS